MPLDTPSLNSTRILRANRLNSVETVKLRNELLILDKSKVREIRLVNQDIRMINLTLDYIKSSSGYSPEGLPPDYVEKTKKREIAPMFLYGERIASRKMNRKYRRVQSAFSGGFMGKNNEEKPATDLQVENQEPSTKSSRKKNRPKSSPAKTLAQLHHSFDINEHDIEPETLISRTKQRSSNSVCEAGADLQPVVSTNSKPVKDPNPDHVQAEKQYRIEHQCKTDTKIDVNDDVPALDHRLLSGRPRSRRRGQMHSRNHEMTKKVNDARVAVLNAKKAKPDPIQAWTSNIQTNRERDATEKKKSLNDSRKLQVENKIKNFLDSHPLKRY